MSDELSAIQEEARAALKPVHERCGWIRTTLETHLPRPIGGTVALLAVGNAEEAMIVRELAPNAQIVMFDVEASERAAATAFAYDVKYITGPSADIRMHDQVIAQIGQTPDTIILRHPRIIEAVSPKVIITNDWWLDCIALWVQKAQVMSSQILMTTFTKFEVNAIIARIREKTGIELRYQKNVVVEPELRQVYQTREGRMVSMPDHFVVAADFSQ